VEETTSVDGPLVRLEVAMRQRQHAQPHHVFKPVQEGDFLPMWIGLRVIRIPEDERYSTGCQPD